MSVRERETDDLCFCNCTRCECVHCKCIATNKQNTHTVDIPTQTVQSFNASMTDWSHILTLFFLSKFLCYWLHTILFCMEMLVFMSLSPLSNHWWESLAMYLHIVSQAPQHSRYCETSSLWWLLLPSSSGLSSANHLTSGSKTETSARVINTNGCTKWPKKSGESQNCK